MLLKALFWDHFFLESAIVFGKNIISISNHMQLYRSILVTDLEADIGILHIKTEYITWNFHENTENILICWNNLCHDSYKHFFRHIRISKNKIVYTFLTFEIQINQLVPYIKRMKVDLLRNVWQWHQNFGIYLWRLSHNVSSISAQNICLPWSENKRRQHVNTFWVSKTFYKVQHVTVSPNQGLLLLLRCIINIININPYYYHLLVCISGVFRQLLFRFAYFAAVGFNGHSVNRAVMHNRLMCRMLSNELKLLAWSSSLLIQKWYHRLFHCSSWGGRRLSLQLRWRRLFHCLLFHSACTRWKRCILAFCIFSKEGIQDACSSGVRCFGWAIAGERRTPDLCCPLSKFEVQLNNKIFWFTW